MARAPALSLTRMADAPLIKLTIDAIAEEVPGFHTIRFAPGHGIAGCILDVDNGDIDAIQRCAGHDARNPHG